MIQHFRGDSPLQARGVLSGGKQNSFRSGYNLLLKCEASGGWQSCAKEFYRALHDAQLAQVRGGGLEQNWEEIKWRLKNRINSLLLMRELFW